MTREKSPRKIQGSGYYFIVSSRLSVDTEAPEAFYYFINPMNFINIIKSNKKELETKSYFKF
jgi:hypothetical protein